MKLSKNGINLVKDFEGYHKKLPNGDCTTYYCPANVLTIGYGCTEGIRKGEVWTHEQAINALKKELKRFEDAVNDLVKVDINQNQFDALVSFAYNCGSGALSKSSLLKCVNAGDFAGAARQFSNWTRGGGRVLPGLVRRRAAEAALFQLKPEEASEPQMPQAVDAPPVLANVTADDLVSRTIRDANVLKIIGGSVGAGAAAKGVQEANAPTPPPTDPVFNAPGLEDVASHLTVMQTVMEGIGSLSKLVVQNYWIAGIVAGIALWWYGRRIISWYIDDIRTGKRQPVFKITKTLIGS